MHRAILFACLYGLASGAFATPWQVVQDRSELRFAVQTDIALGDTKLRFEARLPEWQARIMFDPADPASGCVWITIDLAALPEVDAGPGGVVTGPDWLDVADHPTATYIANGFTLISPQRYRTQGELTLRGTTRPVELEFDLTITDNLAAVSGLAIVQRTEFAIGPEGGPIAAGVEVTFDLIAEQGG